MQLGGVIHMCEVNRYKGGLTRFKVAGRSLSACPNYLLVPFHSAAWLDDTVRVSWRNSFWEIYLNCGWFIVALRFLLSIKHIFERSQPIFSCGERLLCANQSMPCESGEGKLFVLITKPIDYAVSSLVWIIKTWTASLALLSVKKHPYRNCNLMHDIQNSCPKTNGAHDWLECMMMCRACKKSACAIASI